MNGQVRKHVARASGCIIVCAMAACSSNPPPKPLPEPQVPRGSQRSAEGASQETTRAAVPTPRVEAQASKPAAQPAPAAGVGAPGDPPAWYRQGPFEMGGREHRAFASTATDVREARTGAMRLAYEAYPSGVVAAHEALRSGDGRWTFYVLMASGG